MSVVSTANGSIGGGGGGGGSVGDDDILIHGRPATAADIRKLPHTFARLKLGPSLGRKPELPKKII